MKDPYQNYFLDTWGGGGNGANERIQTSFQQIEEENK